MKVSKCVYLEFKVYYN